VGRRKIVKIRKAGFKSVGKRLDKFVDDTCAKAEPVLWDEINWVIDIARLMTPVKTRALEISIEKAKIYNKKGNKIINYGLSINGSVRNPQTKKSVREYAEIVHEEVTPVGHKNIGVISQEKDASSPYTVGGGFLTRALQITKTQFQQLMRKVVRDQVTKFKRNAKTLATHYLNRHK